MEIEQAVQNLDILLDNILRSTSNILAKEVVDSMEAIVEYFRYKTLGNTDIPLSEALFECQEIISRGGIQGGAVLAILDAFKRTDERQEKLMKLLEGVGYQRHLLGSDVDEKEYSDAVAEMDKIVREQNPDSYLEEINEE